MTTRATCAVLPWLPLPERHADERRQTSRHGEWHLHMKLKEDTPLLRVRKTL